MMTAPRTESTAAEKALRLILDLGTTTLVGRLLAPSGDVLAEQKRVNPQRVVAADILLRLQRAHEGEGKRLQQLLGAGLRELIDDLVTAADVTAAEIGLAVAAGNPGMTCLLRGLPVASLLSPPHRPADRGFATLSPAECDLGLSVPLQLFPAISGFVGGDLVACLFSLGEVPVGTVCIDIGTNGELALRADDRWWVTSAAAGPAFEGGNIGCGMLMTDGAVTDVQLDGDRLVLQVAGDGLPKGLCGSGLAALIAAARDGSLINHQGRILAVDEADTNLARYLCDTEQGGAIRFYRDARTSLCLTQEDVRQFQLAKGALYAGLEVLLEHAGVGADDLAQVMVTGALGTALPVETLKRVALLPAAVVDKTRFVPNGVLAGLARFLGAADGRQQLDALLALMQPFPLSGTPSFERHFLTALEF